MGRRVLQISVDILVSESIDGTELASLIMTELSEYGLGLTVLGSEFQCDITEEYSNYFKQLEG